MSAAQATLRALRDGALGGARALDLSGLGLTEVPREVFDLAATLEVLDLSRNRLTCLPADFGRLRALRILFCSGNPFTRLPPVLGDCPALSQVGFRGCAIREVPAESLPPALRWLTLTDNAIETLPDALGACPALRKVMLAGNRLTALPDSLAEAANLELLRLSANGFAALPGWLTTLPRLAWLAWAGNPLETRAVVAPPATVDWSALRVEALLGEGASGRIHRALWRAKPDAAATPVAVKLYKGAMTSDGLPEHEMAACLAAGDHPNLVGGLGLLRAHPDGAHGLLMPLLPPQAEVLAGPPSLVSCSRDVYDPTRRFTAATALHIARDIAAATRHLHAKGLSHGDLYAHNILWDPTRGAAMLSDFGAASFMPEGQASSLRRLDILAWGLLLGELLERCDDPAPAAAHDLRRACTSPISADRPDMDAILARLDTMGATPSAPSTAQ